MSSDLLKNVFTHTFSFLEKKKKIQIPLPEKPSLKMNFQHEMSEQGQMFYPDICYNSVDHRPFSYTNEAFLWREKKKGNSRCWIESNTFCLFFSLAQLNDTLGRIWKFLFVF